MGGLIVGIHGGNKDANALVKDTGELVVGSLKHSDSYYVNIAVAATSYELVPAIPGMRFIITGVLMASDKTFATVTEAEAVTIYEANPADIDINTKTIFSVPLLRNDRLAATGLDLQTNLTVSLVTITPTTAAVDVTITGYYIPA
jgi:hypothetical protein